MSSGNAPFSTGPPNDPGMAAPGYVLNRDAWGNMAIGSTLPNIVPGAVPNHAQYNVAYGRSALANLTQGSLNTAIGDSALTNFTTAPYGLEPAGGENTAVGQGCMSALIDGYWNTAIGRTALNGALHDVRSTAVGWNALVQANVGTGNIGDNTGVGAEAGGYITTGRNNTAIGSLAMAGTNTAITGNQNTAIGFSAMSNMQGTGANNTAVGGNALLNVTSGNENTAIGDGALTNTITSSYNTALGRNAGPTTDAVSFSVCIGRNTSVTQWGAIAIGVDSAGTSATSTVQDQISLGTALHKIKVSNNATGAGSAALGTNCPATTVTAPYTWFRMTSNDGSTVYVPAWK